MHFAQTLVLALATAVGTTTAIDIRLNVANNCGNANSLVCRGINPNTCCPGSTNDIFPSVGFYGIPTSWTLSVRGHSGGNCRNTREVQRVANSNFRCLTNGWFSGGGYGFASKKRGAAVDALSELSARCPAGSQPQGCTSFAKPDLLLLADGGKYDIAGVEGEALTKIYDLAAAGANSSDVDEEFSALKIVE